MQNLDRRSLLKTAVGGAAAGVTGCLDAFDDRPEGVVLSPPEQYELLRNAELQHPVYGEPMPDVTVHDPLNDEDVSTGDYRGERHVVTTLFFTRCQETCPTLVSNLVQVQAEAASGGWTDEVALLAVTFDPEHDTEEVLREYAGEMGVDLDAGNFRFLRPRDTEHAREVVEKGFGGVFERSRVEDHANVDGDGHSHGNESEDTHEHNESEHSHEGDDGGQSGDDGGDGVTGGEEGQEYVHSDLTLFANRDGVVERAYTPSPPAAPTVVDDVRTVVEHYRE